MAVCPHCGNRIDLVKAGRQTSSTRRTAKSRFNSSYGAAGEIEAPVPMIERRGPARDATVESDVQVPVLQAGITGICAFALSIIPVFAWGWVWWSPFLIGIVTFAALWLALLSSHRQSLWFIEDLLDRDIDGDGHTGKPINEPIRIDIVETQEDGRKGFRFVDIVDVTPKQLVTFAYGATVLNRSLAIEEWTPSANGFSKRKYTEFIRRLDGMNWTRFVDPQYPAQGRTLTTAGRRILRQIADKGL